MEDLTPVQEALVATSFGNWYPTFRAVSPKATILDVLALEPGFLQWLEADSIVLPKNSGPPIPSDDEEEAEAPTFPNLDSAIQTLLARYEGSIFPKLNWSSPQDASWILPGSTLRCISPQDVYLLLKSSDFISKDIEQLYELDNPPRLELVCKMWFDMPKSHEFRCFILQGRLIAVAQRDVTFYDHLQPQDVQQKVLDMIQRFYKEELRDKIKVKDFIWDAYLTRGMNRVFLVDINPFLPRTDPLLFSWQELFTLPSPPPLRLITSHAQASQSFPTFSSNMVPRDVIDVSSGQNIAQFAKEWQNQVQNAM